MLDLCLALCCGTDGNGIDLDWSWYLPAYVCDCCYLLEVSCTCNMRRVIEKLWVQSHLWIYRLEFANWDFMST